MSLSINKTLLTDLVTRAQDADTPAAAAPTEQPDAQKAEALQKVEAALQELEQFYQENGEWLSEDNQQELDRLRLTLKAEEAAIHGWGVNGAPNDNNNDGIIDSADYLERPTELADGWNGHYELTTDLYPSDRELVEGNQKYGTYAGTIEIIAGSETGIAFSMTPEMAAVKAESHGRDLILTVTFHDGHKESYVIREGSVRPDPIIIDATKAGKDGEGVVIDLSHAFRVSDGSYNTAAGTKTGFYIHGSEFNDEIYGSQGDDSIVGWAGSDIIDAQGGNDAVFGDEFYTAAGGFQRGYGGRDDLRGGAGADQIWGGDGIDTRYRSDNSEYTVDLENNLNDGESAIPANNNWLPAFGANNREGTRGWESREEDGMVVLSNNGLIDDGGTINIDMSQMDGYTMAFAEGGEDGSLIITFVGENADGTPKTFKVKIEGFFNASVGQGTRLIINGSNADDIIDFSKLTGPYQLTNQVLQIHGGSGDDMIIGAENKLQNEGVTPDSLTRSTGQNQAELNRFVNDEIIQDNSEEDESSPFNTTVQGDVILVRGTEGRVPPEGTTLSINAPVGYEVAYITQVGEERYVTLVQPGDPAKTIVIKVAAELNDVPIEINSTVAEGEASTAIQPIYLGDSRALLGFIQIDGERGEDVIYARHGTRVASDNNDFVLEGDLRGAGLDDTPGRPPEET